MRISAKAEYACIAMYELARSYRDAQPARIKTIAEQHTISPGFLVLILLGPTNDGLVTSRRGAGGGYHLARPPEQVSLADIVHAVDIPVPHGTAGKNKVRSPVQQALRKVWNDIEDQEQSYLRQVHLAELVRRTQGSDLASYQI